jgi:Helix-turn-helix domain
VRGARAGSRDRLYAELSGTDAKGGMSAVDTQTSPLPVMLTVKQIAEATQFHPATIRAAITRGDLAASQLSGRWRVHPDDYEAWRCGAHYTPSVLVAQRKAINLDDYRL